MSYYNDSELTLTSYNACIYSAMKIFIIADFLLCQCCYQLQYSQCHWTQLTILWQLLEAKMTRHMFGEYKMERRIWNVLVGFDKVEDIMSVEVSQQILHDALSKKNSNTLKQCYNLLND